MTQNIVCIPNNKIFLREMFQRSKYLKINKKFVFNYYQENNICVQISKYSGFDTLNKFYLRMDFVNIYDIPEHEIFIVFKYKEHPFFEKEVELFRLSYFFLKSYNYYESNKCDNNNRNSNLYYSDASSKYLRVPLEILIGEVYLFPDELDKLIISIEYKKKTFNESQDNLNAMNINHLHNFIEDLVTYAECIVEGTLYGDEKKSTMKIENFKGQQIQYMNVYKINKSKFSVPLHFNGICKGLLICMDDFEDIFNLEIHINNQVHIEYDKELIAFMCKKINNYMYYIPFDVNYELDCDSANSYDCNILFNNETNIKLYIESESSVSEIFIQAMMLTNYMFKNNRMCNIPHFDVVKYYKFCCERGTFIGNKVLDIEKNTCVISHDEIKNGAYYSECMKCKNAVISSVLNQYFDINNDRRCPMCRANWDNRSEEIYFYCNKENDFSSIFYPESISYLEEIKN